MQTQTRVAEDAEILMQEYLQTGSIEIRNQLVMHYSYIAKTVAAEMSSTYYKYANVNEMINQGVIALIDSIERYNPDYGARFSTFAFTKVRGAIIDYVRAQDWLPRRVRANVIRLRRAHEELVTRLGRYPTNAEMAAHLGMTPEQYDACVSETAGERMHSYESLSLMCFAAGEEATPLHAAVEGPQECFDEQEMREQLAAAIDELGEQERAVLTMYYYDNLTMKEIGGIMGVTEQRIGQINRRLILRLRDRLTDYVKG